MSKKNLEVFSDLLYNSFKNSHPIEPLTQTDNSLTVDDAYEIQLLNVKRVVAEGEIISGKKIGLTSKGIQKQMGVDEPDYGHLFRSMDYTGREINTENFILPKIEGELAFILKEDLVEENITKEQVLLATDYIAAAFEIVDSRIENWDIKLVDTIADNASSGCYILGSKKIKPNEVDLGNISMELYKNDELIGEGNSKAVLENPAIAVAWLANRVRDYGVFLKKGDVILSGAFSAAPEARKEDIFTAKFSSFGEVKAKFI